MDKYWSRCQYLHGASLQFVQGVVEATVLQELFVCAAFADYSILEYVDHIGVDDGGQSVGYADCGASLSSSVQCFLNDLQKWNKREIEMNFWATMGVFLSDLTFSLSASNADVASSNRRIFGFLIRARAMAMRCFCPPDSWVPFSPIRVS